MYYERSVLFYSNVFTSTTIIPRREGYGGGVLDRPSHKSKRTPCFIQTALLDIIAFPKPDPVRTVFILIWIWCNNIMDEILETRV